MTTKTHRYLRLTPGDWSRDNDLHPMTQAALGEYTQVMLLEFGFNLCAPIERIVKFPCFDVVLKQRLDA